MINKYIFIIQKYYLLLNINENNYYEIINILNIYYFNNKIKRIHDLVHVEVFLKGENNKQTIAAWNRKGVIEIYNDYIFETTRYHNIKIIFKSIDTWLEGICWSFCNLH